MTQVTDSLKLEKIILEIQACKNIISGAEVMILLDDQDGVSKAEHVAMLEKYSVQLASCEEGLDNLKEKENA